LQSKTLSHLRITEEPPVPKAQIILTSCSRRSLEIEQLRHYLLGNGYTLSTDDWRVDPQADVILLSTCGFTQAAEDFGFASLRRVQAAVKPDTLVIFGGCIPEIDPGRTRLEFHGPTFSPQSYTHLDEILQTDRGFETFKRPNTLDGAGSPALIQDTRKAVELIKTFDGSFSGLAYISNRLGNGLRRRMIRSHVANLDRRDTYYIQIQEGCSMRCSYCAIRLAIGPLRSRPVEALMAEFRAGLELGYRQFQLVGDNAGSYGLDLGINLGHLLERILEVDSDYTLDLTDINPVYLPLFADQLMRLLDGGKLSRLYIAIQSGSRRILKLMNRDPDLESVRRTLEAIRQTAPPDFKLGTSLIVGFPSETLDDLQATLQFCKRVGFDWVWCHSYSSRPGTPAADLPDQLPPEEIHRRARGVKAQLSGRALVTTADDTAGNRTCQG
jgi:threonylcarbamoyladenosine tRNA methylthiotransferase MtaB